MDVVLQKERHRYMPEKSLCSPVCATVQDEREESWSSYWKSPYGFIMLPEICGHVVLQLQLPSLWFRTGTGRRCAVSFESYYDRK